MSYSSAIPRTLLEQREGRRERGPASSTTPNMSAPSHGTDSAVSSEDIQALSLLYERFRRSIYSYTYRLLGNREDAADVTQEVFLRACLAWESLRDRDHLGVWLHHVATNICVDLLRRRSRLSWWPLARRNRSAAQAWGVGDDDPFSRLPPDSGGIPEIAEREQIHLALARMPQEYAIVLILSAVQGLSYQEIAVIVGISPAATATRISRAKKLFVEQYQRLSQEGGGPQEKRS